MATKFFETFQKVGYNFGDNEAPVLFDNLTAYVDIIDSLKENAAFYNKYTILPEDRPDTVSFKLYGTVDYYWTFFLMNDDLRRDGWPIYTNKIDDIAMSKYPNRTLTTTANIADTFLQPVSPGIKH